jgi:hypothetical protein
MLAVGCGRIAFDPIGGGTAACRILTVTAPADPLGADYSIPVTFDHAALVAAGRSAASGDDVSIELDGVAIDRVLDVESAWSSSTTQLWFRLQRPLASGEMDAGYALCAGGSGTSTLANPDNVYVLFDDFSAPTLDTAKWMPVGPASVSVANGVLVVSGTTTASSGNDVFGVNSQLLFQADISVEASFAIVNQSALAQQNWKGDAGLEETTLTLMAINSDGSPVKRTQYWTGAWTDVGPSTLDATTFGPQRIGDAATADGTVRHFEHHVVQGTRSAAIVSRGVALYYGPDIPNETFMVTFDDVVVRRYVASDAAIGVVLAP